MIKQRTIAKKVENIGIGLHKGEPVKLVLEPALANTGIVFYRSDIDASFEAKALNIKNTQLATVLGDLESGRFISTIEHLMSAISAYGIDNIKISVDANEVPIMDGSALSFCMMLDEAGISEQGEPKQVLVVKKEVIIKDGAKMVALRPSSSPKFNFSIDFARSAAIGKQSFSFEFSKKTYLEHIARARTFGFLDDVKKLNAMGLALGGSLDNAIVIDGDKILNPDGLRYENEFVRHKILDAIGDLNVFGAQILGDYEAIAGSHELNHKLSLELLSDASNYELVSLKSQESKELSRVFA